jgi:hypothetical protein
MNLIQCKTCTNAVSPNAPSCPHCGEIIKIHNNPVRALAWIILALLIGWVLTFAVSAFGRDVAEVIHYEVCPSSGLEEYRSLDAIVGWLLKDKANNLEYFYLPDGRVMVYKVEAELYGEYDKDGKPILWWQLDEPDGGIWEYFPDGHIEYITEEELGC